MAFAHPPASHADGHGNEDRPIDRRSLIWKNGILAALLAALALALTTGYLSPDRAPRYTWEIMDRIKAAPAGRVAYQADFAKHGLGVATPAGTWGRYNGASEATTQFDPAGITINQQDAAWLGAVFNFKSFVPGGIYRVVLDTTIEGDPGAFVVRNRQLDLMREELPAGKKSHTMHFVAPPGSLDSVYLVVMPNGRDKPKGTIRISGLRVELMEIK
jgi:hypothetical protein